MKKPVAFRLDVDLLGRVDVVRGDVSRTRFVERALEVAVDVPEGAGVQLARFVQAKVEQEASGSGAGAEVAPVSVAPPSGPPAEPLSVAGVVRPGLKDPKVARLEKFK